MDTHVPWILILVESVCVFVYVERGRGCKTSLLVSMSNVFTSGLRMTTKDRGELKIVAFLKK